ncbi:MAG: alanine--tRNA ligase, partial [Acidimicrobiia bacterium]
DELSAARKRDALQAAGTLAREAEGGIVVARKDGLGPDDLRQLAVATRAAVGGDAVVVLLGVNDGKAGLVGALGPDRVAAGLSAATLVAPVAKLLGGGTAKNPELVVGGGPNVGAIDDAVALARAEVAELAAPGA